MCGLGRLRLRFHGGEAQELFRASSARRVASKGPEGRGLKDLGPGEPVFRDQGGEPLSRAGAGVKGAGGEGLGAGHGMDKAGSGLIQ